MQLKIKFAPLIRVSTERQEKKGESLNTQKKQIIDYVDSLDGIIPDVCWQYTGQEHATPDQERKILDKLLTDSGKGFFDAVIVCDASRWSRDNGKNDEGLKILIKNSIRFFVGTKEFMLRDPKDFMILSMEAVFNAFQAAEQTKKSLLNRLEKAKRNIPTAGRLPFGRTHCKETNTWGIDTEKQKKIEYAAEMYLKGINTDIITATLDMNWPNLLKILKFRSGNHWDINFRQDDLGINETVPLKIPRLLPEETIQAIHQKTEANKTYTHGKIKNTYLLSRMIFCKHCGSTLSGQTNHSNKRYYRHRKRKQDFYPKCVNYIPADDIENAVFIHLFKTFGDVENIEKAITRAIPDPTQLKKLEEQYQLLESKSKKIELGKKRLIIQVKEGNLMGEDVKNEMQTLRDQQQEINLEKETIKSQLENIPSKKRRKKSAQLMKRFIQRIYSNPNQLSEMSLEDRKILFQTAFAGKDQENNRLGVYLKRYNKNGERIIGYEINGKLGKKESNLPMTFDEYISVFGKNYDDTYSSDVEIEECKKEFEAIKLNISSKRDAHHSVCFYQ